MEQFLSQIPTNPIGIFSSLIVVIAGVVYLRSRTRKDYEKLLEASNTELRSAHDDNDKKISKLIEDVKCLTDKVAKLENEKRGLETLVVEALELYFQRNPKEALKIRNK